jgi:hypothetical protein
MPTGQQKLYLHADRHSAAKHVQKSRNVDFSQCRTSPVRSGSTPTAQCHVTALQKAHDNITSRERGSSMDAVDFPDYAQALVDRQNHRHQPQPALQQSSAASSYVESRNTQWHWPEPQPPADCSPTDISCLDTPGLTFSDVGSSCHQFKFVARCSTSSFDSGSLEPEAEENTSRPEPPSIPLAGFRPKLQVHTSFQGTTGPFGDYCDSPVASDLNDEFPYSAAENPMVGYSNGTREWVKSQVFVEPHHCANGLDEGCSDCLRDLEIIFESDVASGSSFEGSLSRLVSATACPCHFLHRRPAFDLPEPGAILKACALYFRQMRPNRQMVLRRLQDTFAAEWQRVCKATLSLQKHLQSALSTILHQVPTLQDGLDALKLLNTGKRPESLQGYISLAFFAKAWLTLEEQPDLSDVTTALFVETTHCVAAMARLVPHLEQQAYDILLQLLWQPVTAETYELFCPVFRPRSICWGTDDSRLKAATRARPKWILSHVCRGIVECKILKSSTRLC